jgi:hypothetical protein
MKNPYQYPKRRDKKMKPISKVLIDHSMYRGLNSLQSYFLSEEIRKDNNRPVSTLRHIAKKKAFAQRVKWLMEETLTVMAIFGVVAISIISILIWNM